MGYRMIMLCFSDFVSPNGGKITKVSIFFNILSLSGRIGNHEKK